MPRAYSLSVLYRIRPRGTHVRAKPAFCSDDTLSFHLPPDSDASGRLAIWLRDLEAWANTQLRDAAPGSRGAFKMAAPDDSRTRLALSWIEALESVEQTLNPWETLSGQRDDPTRLFCLHQQSRARLDDTSFADAWAPGGAWVGYLKTFSRLRDALQHVPAFVATHWPEVALAVIKDEKRESPENVFVGKSTRY